MTNQEIKANIIASESYKIIMRLVKKHHRINARIAALEEAGERIENHPMGSGGIGQVRVMKDHYRIQVTSGYSRHNYADCVIIKKEDSNFHVPITELVKRIMK